MAKKKVARKRVVKDELAFDVDNFIAEINKKYGEGSLVKASEANLIVDWIPTGCAAIDISSGGGIPESRITELFGAESSGKTTLALSTLREFQKKHPKGLAVFVDVERTFDVVYAEKLGVNPKRLILANPDSGEQAIDLVKVCCQKEVPVFIVVDSIAAMTPSNEYTNDADKNFVGAHPRLINSMMRVVTSRMKRNLARKDAPTTTVLMLNQTREKIGIMFGNPETTPGGKGKNFFAGLRMRLFSSDAKSNQIKVKKTRQGIERNVLVGRKINYTIIKNKCGGTPFEEGEYEYYNRRYKGHPAFSYNNADILFELGVFYKAIQLDDNTGEYYYSNGADEICYKSKAKFVEQLIEHEEVQDDLRDEILAQLKEWNIGEEDE